MIIFTKSHKDRIKIVDFLLIAKFWACLLFFIHPLVLYSGSLVCPYRVRGNIPDNYARFPHEYDCTMYYSCYKVKLYSYSKSSIQLKQVVQRHSLKFAVTLKGAQWSRKPQIFSDRFLSYTAPRELLGSALIKGSLWYH